MSRSAVFVALGVTASFTFTNDAQAEPNEAATGTRGALEQTTSDGRRAAPTGSRISSAAQASLGPAIVLQRAQLLASGKTTIAEILQRLTVNTNAINIQTNGGGDGTSRISLRGLGSDRTLVLLNGRRFVAGGNGANGSVDLNAIPLTIVDRIEILNNGASAIYGADAVSGVVNIITRSGFSGVEASAYTNLSERGDARLYQIDAIAGVASERGSALFSVTFLDQQPVFSGDRDFSDSPQTFDFAAYDDAGRPDDFERFIDPTGGNSSAPPQGNIVDRTNAAGNGVWESTGCAGGTCTNDPTSGWIPGTQTYNFQPETLLVTPNRRLSLYAEGKYALSRHFEVYFESNFTNRTSRQTRASVPLFTVTSGIVVSSENRFNPFGRDFTDIRRRLIEAGSRSFAQDSNTFRTVVGVRGELPFEGWQWDAYGNFGRTETTNEGTGQVSQDRLELALGPESQCTGACVPLDLFGGAGSITEEMLDYIGYTSVARGFSEQNIVGASVTGELYELVRGRPITLSAGYQFRREVGADVPDPLSVIEFSAANVDGQYEVHAAFAELWAPILRGLPGAERLDLHAAGRLASFNRFTQAAGQVSIRWNPVRPISLRGSLSTAFRAPNIREISIPQSEAFASFVDPCAEIATYLNLDGRLVTESINCANDGFPDGVFDRSTTFPIRVGGDPDLEPETSTMLTLGLVLEDRLIDGLTASLSYFSVDVDSLVQALGPSVIVDSCYRQTDRRFCDRITRATTGAIEFVDDRLANFGSITTAGLDFDVRYRPPPTMAGRFELGLSGTVLTQYTQTLSTGFEQSFRGNRDGAFANPDYRLNADLRWALDIVSAGINFRFIPGIVECGFGQATVQCESDRAPGATLPIERPVDDYMYLDVFAGINGQTLFGHSQLTVGINNLTDATPPFIAGGFTATTDERLYDFVGRQYYARLTQTF